jgi:hypothetical protein
VRRIFRMDLERQLCRVTSSGMRFSHTNFLGQFSGEELPSEFSHKNASSHNSSFKSAWTWFILCLTLYTAVMVPYSVAFQYNGSPQASAKQTLFWLIIDSFVDVGRPLLQRFRDRDDKQALSIYRRYRREFHDFLDVGLRRNDKRRQNYSDELRQQLVHS